MENFVLHNPVKLHFGKNVTKKLPATVREYGNRVLLVYGRGSIKQSGLYDQIVEQLTAAGIEVIPYGGIKSNPIIEDVREATIMGKEKDVTVIVAAGGGSVIDSAKAIAAGIVYNGDPWDFFDGTAKPIAALPLITILTLAATGTEMNANAVIQNKEAGMKTALKNRHIYPVHSFLDPSYTLTVPVDYTAYGIVDLMSHVLEQYFGEGDAPLSDQFAIAILQEGMEAGAALMKNLNNYLLRARIMYASTMALNGLCSAGRKNGDWGVHAIGHVLSMLFDTPHGVSLSIVYPAWLKLMRERIPDRLSELMFDLFKTADIDTGIYKLEHFFTSIGSPVSLKGTGIGKNKHTMIINQMIKNKVNGNHLSLTEDDYHTLIQLM